MTAAEKDAASEPEYDFARERLMRKIKLGILIGSAILILLSVTAIAFLVSFYEKIRIHHFNSTNSSSYVPPNDTDYGERLFKVIDEQECGVVKAQNNLRIVGGSAAVPGSWPWSVFIVFDVNVPELELEPGLIVYNQDLSFTCGGTLISLDTVLTAAHCASVEIDFPFNGGDYLAHIDDGTLLKGLTVYLGVTNITEIILNGHTKYGIERRVTRISRHEQYDYENIVHDIALLHLNQPAILTDNIQIACLPEKESASYPKPNTQVYAVGWGVRREDDEYISSLLENVELTVYNYSLCENVTESHKHARSQLCIGDLSGLKDTCQGDSGGAIFTLDTYQNKTKYIAAGIVSYGEGCARKGMPGIYTRTSYYLDWILTNMKH